MSIHPRVTAKGERRYDVRLRDGSGTEYSTTFRTRRDAERFEASERTDRARGTWIDPRRMNAKLADIAEEWLTSHPSKKESTLARDEAIVRGHIAPALGDHAVGQITSSHVQRVVNDWTTHLSPRTVRRQYAVLRAIFNLAIDTDRIGRSPCRKIKLPEERPVHHHIISPAELHDLAGALGPDDAPMVYVAAILGLRWGEAAGLRIGDVDFLGGTVSIQSQRTRGLKGRMVTGDPKWNSDRSMAAPAALLELLAEHLLRRHLTGAVPDALLFVGPRGESLHYSNWRRRVWVPACETAKLADLKFQSLRTANSTAMVALAVDVKTAQTRAGHRNAKTTLDIYARPTAAADREAATRLGAWFLGADPAAARDDPANPANPPITRDGRGMAPQNEEERPPERALDLDFFGGAGQNRTVDLSIISAAL